MDFAFADPARRTFLALNREGTGYHFVHPAALDDPRVGDGLRRAGELTCECRGGRFRGTCYVVKAAEAALSAETPPAEDWFGADEAVPA